MVASAEDIPRIGRGVGTSKEDKLYEPADDIILLFDGTWCGKATGTTGNVKILADAFASEGDLRKLNPEPDEFGEEVYERRFKQNVRYVRYYEGPGIEGSLESYLINGMFALDVKEHCVKVYETIVRRYRPGSRIWLFGLSRGAFIVRSVAAMINNFGILKLTEIDGITGDPANQGIKDSRKPLHLACQAVYDMYRNHDPYYKPESTFSKRFRQKKSWQPLDNQSKPPIRFMGLFDTVGALGVPSVQAGVHFGYEFYDQKISSEVQTVCQALAMTDRLSVFEPCYVRRGKEKYMDRIELETEEVWFAGSHYDIGRQRFIFLRKFFDESSSNPETTPRFRLVRLIESVPRAIEGFGRWALQTLQILQVDYTPQLSDPPLLYIIERVKRTAEGSFLLPRDAEEYLKAFRDDARGLEETLKPITEWAGLSFGIDAYDAIYDAWRSIPFVGRLFNGVVNDQLLADRSIPQYRSEVRTAFYKANLKTRPDNGKVYRSEAFDRYKGLIGGESQVVYLSCFKEQIPPEEHPDAAPDTEAQGEPLLHADRPLSLNAEVPGSVKRGAGAIMQGSQQQQGRAGRQTD